MKTIKGCFIESIKNNEFQAYAHQTNCQGVMGSGLAKDIKSQLPEVFNVYASNPKNIGGFTSTQHYGPHVINMNSQDRYGRHSRHTNYAALVLSIMKYIHDLKLKELAIPYMIGCVRGGGNWLTVQEILMDVEKITGCEIVVIKKETK